MKATIPVTQRHWSTTGVDEYGNPVATFTDETRLVFGWWVPGSDAPAGGNEVSTAGRDGVIADVAFLAPRFPVDDRDEFIIPEFSDQPLRVQGEPRPWDFGPFGFRPGMQVNLLFAEG